MKKIIVLSLVLFMLAAFSMSQVIEPPVIDIGTKLTQEQLDTINLDDWNFNEKFIEERIVGDNFYAVHSYTIIEPNITGYEVKDVIDEFTIQGKDWMACMSDFPDIEKTDYDMREAKCKADALVRWEAEYKTPKREEMKAMQTAVVVG